MEDLRKDIEMMRILGRPVQDLFLFMVDRAHELGYGGGYSDADSGRGFHPHE